MKYLVFYDHNIKLNESDLIELTDHPWMNGRQILDEPDPRYPIYNSGNSAVQPPLAIKKRELNS